MSDYREPISVSSKDPICSASALNGTVVGILFHKKGSEIKGAITSRVVAIDEKIDEYEKLITGTDEFLKDKEKEIEELDKIYEEQDDKKKEKLRPFERQVEDLQRTMEDINHQADLETEKRVGERAVVFEEGFRDKMEAFEIIDDFLDEEEDSRVLRSMSLRSRKTSGVQIYNSDVQGETGPQGVTGPQGEPYIYTNSAAGTYTFSSISQDENRALARLSTLKDLVKNYAQKVLSIRGLINTLKEERRRLVLIQDNLDEDREYKLDLNKLSAFGFEDISIEE